MKKFVYLLVFLTAFSASAFSQKITSGTLDVLKSQPRVNINLDFSKAIIHGMSVEKFAEYERDWETDKPTIVSYFVGEASRYCTTVPIGLFPEAAYTVNIRVQSINTKGNYVCEADVTSAAGDKIATIAGLEAKGGHVGSKLNLIKDGARHTGAKLGKYLRKSLKK